MADRIHVCIPTLNRYALLASLIRSLRRGTLLPTDIWVIDNGLTLFDGDSLDFNDDDGTQYHYRKYGENLGVAGSWNKLIGLTSDIRVICNDDVRFYPDTLQLLVEAYNENNIVYPAGMPSTNSFSCFLIPDRVIAKTGLFDEEISPKYAYFEDRDYHYRMTLVGCELIGVHDCTLDHFGSSTIAAFNADQMRDHHTKFVRARNNFIAKWGGEPHHETFTLPYDGAARQP